MQQHKEREEMLKAEQQAYEKKQSHLHEQLKQTERTLEELKEVETQQALLKQAVHDYKDVISLEDVREASKAVEVKTCGQLQATLTALHETRKAVHVLQEQQQQRLMEKEKVNSANEQLQLLQQQVSRIAAQVQQEQAQCKSLDKELLKERESRLQERESEQSKMIAELAQRAERQRQVQQQLAEEQNRQETLRATQDEEAKLDKLQVWLEQFFAKMVITMEKQHMSSIHQVFNEHFASWFELFVEENITAAVDESFSPSIQQNGYDTTIHHLSGGEKTSCALAYRLALNKVINNSIQNIRTKGLLILDEPTDGFSSEQLNTLRKVIKTLQLKQIILVSHEERVESFVDNIIRIQKEQHASSVA